MTTIAKRVFLGGVVLASAITLGACSSSKPAGTTTTTTGASPAAMADNSVSKKPKCEKTFGSNADSLNLTYDKTETFGAKDDAFALTFPSKSEWNLTDSGNVINFSVNMKSFEKANNLSFNFMPEAQYLGVDAFADGQLKYAQDNHKNLAIVEDCSVEINGMSARKIVWTGDTSLNKNMKGTQYIMKKNNHMVQVIYNVTAADHDKYIGSAEKIIGSLDIK